MSTSEAHVSEIERVKSQRGQAVASEERKSEYVLAPAPHYPDDEISLVDLIQVILSHKTVLAAVFAAMSLATLAFVLLTPKQYRYETVIELGSYMLPNEKGILSERKYIESLDSAKSKLEKRFITQALNEAAGTAGDLETLVLPKLNVDAPKNGNLLILSTRWESDGEQVLALESIIANSLVQDHIVLANEILEQARQRKDNYKLELKQLTAEVMSLKQQDSVLSQRLARTEQEALLYTKQLQRLDEDISRLVTQKAVYLASQTQPKEAMAILLLDNELKQIRDHRDRLELELKIQLENKKADLQKALADNLSKIELALATEQNVRNILTRFNIDAAVDRDSTLGDALEQTGVVNNQFQLVRPTQVVVQPSRSIKPVGMSSLVQLAIGLALAALMSLIACFVAELVGKVRVERQSTP